MRTRSSSWCSLLNRAGEIASLSRTGRSWCGATERGGQVYAVARDVIAEIDREWTELLGRPKIDRLRALLAELNDNLRRE